MANMMMEFQKEDYGNTSTSLTVSADKNMHELVEPQRYFHERDQPALLFVSLEALVLMTVHSHYHKNEVIGFLSGYRTKTKGPITKKDVFLITDCNPC
jgi:hypothetical protein